MIRSAHNDINISCARFTNKDLFVCFTGFIITSSDRRAQPNQIFVHGIRKGAIEDTILILAQGAVWFCLCLMDSPMTERISQITIRGQEMMRFD